MKSEELFDIVDENDAVTGTAPRSEVHAKGLFHRAAHIWIFNSKGEVLIQLRSPQKDRHPTTWDSSAAGHVDSGENYDTAAAREVVEELGIRDAGPLREIGYVRACNSTGQEFVKVYQTTHEGPFRTCPVEIDRVLWISPGELEKWMRDKPWEFAPALPYLWNLLKIRDS